MKKATLSIVATLAIAIMVILFKTDTLDPNTMTSTLIVKFLISLFMINVVLALFNLFPIPPLDGSKVVLHMAMKLGYYKISNWIYKYENYGMIILMAILFLVPSIIWTPIQAFILYILDIATQLAR